MGHENFCCLANCHVSVFWACLCVCMLAVYSLPVNTRFILDIRRSDCSLFCWLVRNMKISHLLSLSLWKISIGLIWSYKRLSMRLMNVGHQRIYRSFSHLVKVWNHCRSVIWKYVLWIFSLSNFVIYSVLYSTVVNVVIIGAVGLVCLQILPAYIIHNCV